MTQEEMGGLDMPNDHRRTPKPSDGLHRPCFAENHYGDYRPSEQCNSIRANGASIGGGVRCLSLKTYNQTSHSGDYREDDVSVSMTVLGGTYGGGLKCLFCKSR